MSSQELFALLCSKEAVDLSAEVELLLSKGANIHDTNEYGSTPIMEASFRGIYRS